MNYLRPCSAARFRLFHLAGWTIKLWDVRSGQETLGLKAHDDIVSGLAFNDLRNCDVLKTLKNTRDRRAAYLDQACAGDAAVRQQVEALIAAHGQADDFLEALVDGLEPKTPERVGIPLTRLGDYELIAEIARGGMGVVQVCNAIQHAHQKGIIHRDTKPSNHEKHTARPVNLVILLTHWMARPSLAPATTALAAR